MSLKDRSRGYEFAEFEKEILFHRENTGFVEYLTEDGTLFALNPSPFFNGNKNVHYHAKSCEPPQNHSCVEVEVLSEDVAYLPERNGWQKDVLKEIGDWKLFDYQQLLHRKKLIGYDQIINYFSNNYRGDEDILKGIATCSALFAFSSPPVTETTGGVNTAVLSKKTLWDAFKKPLKIIPHDFFKPDSKIFYRISDRETNLPQLSCEEINLAYLRPEKMMADIPIVLDDVSIKGNPSYIQQDHEDNKNFVTGYLLDSLMLKPDPLHTVEKAVTDAVYEISDAYSRSGISPYRQNLGDAIPTLSASITRLHLDSETKSTHVKEVVDLWKEMQKKVKFRMGDSLPVARFYNLSDNARKLYTELNDTFGKEFWIPMQEVLTITSLKNNTDFIHALNELVEQGLAIRDRRGVKILERLN
ncbi:MAG: hypothetical protein ABFD07_06265 [Methanobacterium sp.]